MYANVSETVKGLFEDGVLLVQQEVRLAKAETSEKVGQLQRGLVLVIAGLMLGFCALLIFAQALVVALELLIGAWATLVVGGILLLACVIVMAMGILRMNPENLAPSRTAQSLRRDARILTENA